MRGRLASASTARSGRVASASAARPDRSACGGLAVTLGLAALVALAFAGSASAADDPLGAVAQGGASTVGSAAPAAGGDAVAGNLAKVLQLAR